MKLHMKGSVLAAAVAWSLGLTGCGSSGSDGGSPGDTATSGVVLTETVSGETTTSETSGTDIVSSGVITAFGSVYVNGVEYDAGGASVSMDGVSSSEQDLEVGMLVTVDGSMNADGVTGQASDIRFADDIEGVVGENWVPAGRSSGLVMVMGQQVYVTSDTVFDSSDPNVTGIDQLAPNHLVEVSGYPFGYGIQATRIELKSQYKKGASIELKGVVSDLAPQTFSLGSLVVDYSGAVEVPANLADGLYVEVTATSAPSPAEPGSTIYTLAASRVEVEEHYGYDGQEGELVVIEGAVTQPGIEYFVLNNRKVFLSELEGFNPFILYQSQFVRVKAHFNADGDLVAEEVELLPTGEFEFAGVVEAVDTSGVTLLGQPIGVTTTTRMIDQRDDGVTPLKYFGLANIAVGDYVKILAYHDDTGATVATGVSRDDADAAQIRGTVEAVNGTVAVVEGISVDCSGIGVPGLGYEVRVKGSWTGSTLVAAELSLL